MLARMLGRLACVHPTILALSLPHSEHHLPLLHSERFELYDLNIQ